MLVSTRVLFLFLSFISLACSYNSATSEEREIATNAIILAIATTPAPAISCDSTSPSFSTLGTAGFDSSCGRSGCHNGTVRFNTANYSQVRGLTTPGNTNTSTLYSQIKGGMAIYSNPTIDRAVFCWIQGGSNP